MRFTNGERGQGLVEYALVLVLIAIVVIVILSLLGPQIGGVYARVMGGFNGQVVTGEGKEAVVLQEAAASGSGGSCTYTVTGATVILLDEGRGAGNQSATVEMLLDGQGFGGNTATGTTNGGGVISSMNISASGPCGATVTYEW